ncbi:MAG TPA: metal-dependent hydrolase [Gemmatimonadales bacterium]|nr:metal-dependent hydrolase [Gemmatimonadales bacterium]
MFLGHFAVGFAAKRAAPRISLGWLVAAPLLLDLLWPVFVLLGWERVSVVPGDTAFTPLRFDAYPITHSLLTAAGWAALFGAACWAACRDRRGAVVVALGVLSHWVCDAIVHRPDLPLYPGGPLVGLGVWNSVPATLVLEGTAFVTGAVIYTRTAGARRGAARLAWGGLLVFLTASFLAAAFGPPPPSAAAVAVTALVAWIFPVWAWWLDRGRGAAPAGAVA